MSYAARGPSLLGIDAKANAAWAPSRRTRCAGQSCEVLT